MRECARSAYSRTPLLLSQRHQATALDFVHAVGSRQHSLRDALSRSYRDLFFTGSFFDFARLDFVVDLLVRKLALGGDFGEGARASGIGFFVDGFFVDGSGSGISTSGASLQGDTFFLHHPPSD